MHHIRVYSDDFGRYSNTLLVSLNNRASSREAVARKKETAKPLGITFAITVHSEGISDSPMIPRPPAAFKTRSLADSETDERVVVGKWLGCSFLLCQY